MLVVLVVGAALVRPLVAGSLDAEVLQSWATIFVAISVQALPFLVLGVVVSGAIAAYVPPSALARLLPARPVLAVPVAGGGRGGPPGLRVQLGADRRAADVARGRARGGGDLPARRRRP